MLESRLLVDVNAVDQVAVVALLDRRHVYTNSTVNSMHRRPWMLHACACSKTATEQVCAGHWSVLNE